MMIYNNNRIIKQLLKVIIDYRFNDRKIIASHYPLFYNRL